MASERLRVVEVLEATLGGTKKHVLDLCTGLDSKRFEIDAILSRRRDFSWDCTREVLQERGIGVVSIPMVRGPSPVREDERTR